VSVLLCDFSINRIPQIRSIVYHKADAHVKCTDTGTEIEIETGGALSC